MKTDLEHLVFVTNGKGHRALVRGHHWRRRRRRVPAPGPGAARDQRQASVRTTLGSSRLHPASSIAFSAVPAKGDAGLYRAKEGDGKSGWIVLEDGSVRGAKVDADGKFIEGLTAQGGTKWTDAAPNRDPC